jgi:rubredoxin
MDTEVIRVRFIFLGGALPANMNWRCPECGDELDSIYSSCRPCGYVPPQGAD